MDKTYESAIELLNSRRRTGRPTPENLTTLAGQPDLNPTPKRGKPSIHGMKEWLQLLGHSDTDLDVIHIAGTKGKGSTCMFAESFLQAHRHRTGFPSKIGLYTSPHITYVWERIRINSKPISQACFTGYFFEVWDKLYHCSQIKEETANMPRYLQLLALLTYHVFIREGVRVAIIETHSGGEYDATNVTQNTVVAGIATLGLDHTALLGPKIENISWHKAGIIKRGSRAYSAPQDTAAVPVLERRAAEKGAPLEFVKVDPEFPPPAKSLQPEVQRINCALALAVVRGYLEAKAPKGVAAELTLQDVLDGVEQFSWRGRFQHIVEGDHQWFIDGAHNEMSVQIAAEWFAKIAPDMQKGKTSPTRILIFSHISERDGIQLLRNISTALKKGSIQMHHIIFSTYNERADGTFRIDSQSSNPKFNCSMSLLDDYASFWKGFDPEAQIHLDPTIEGALHRARTLGDRGHGMQTFVTGSLHLVGGALSLLHPVTVDDTQSLADGT